ncbi:RNA polymerase II subunit A C-terminal domain phosphatase isoform X2 [Belonocnema kinseyi]|uniref:RNA polymerase II subunit A C-terminal domain phosphatase isoform X2 n=1 Tax=Belonocnema kinseyi TaxID=2817044 RepID=UPI00143DA930|nr:RNA polymerase II subunit A C-terminal domain phosphatase isoform X2 [Belonocnema kinseyi]
MATTEVLFPFEKPAKILRWKVSAGTMISPGKVLLLYKTVTSDNDDKTNPEEKLRAKTERGRVTKFLAKANEIIQPGQMILLLEGCTHPTVMKDLCAECGVDLREGGPGGDTGLVSQASVPMVHSIPELKVCPELAVQIGKADEQRLLRDQKLALLVDLDQTIVHTTNDDVPANIKDVHHYKLPGQRTHWYHTRLRPHTRHFLSEMSRLYELHICTFGVREYAHTVAGLLDKDGELFSHRILSRDECFDPGSKYPNLKALFPCGDDMVCIIDDREDVWQGCGNLVQVKPYYFFRHTANINAPPGMNKLDDPNQPGSSGTSESAGSEKQDKNGVSEEASQLNAEKDPEKKESESVQVEVEKEAAPSDEKAADLKAPKTQETPDEKVADETVNQKSESEPTSKKVEEIADEKLEEVTVEKGEVEKIEEKEDEKSSKESTEVKENNVKPVEETKEEAKKEGEVEYEDQDDYLMYLEDILRRIHKEYYTDLEKEPGRRSLRDIIPRVRARVLKGLTLTFSGIIPTHQKLHQSRAYKVARAFGAQVTQDITEETTHLVAMRPGTQKVNITKKRGDIKIVNPDWLWTCAERWEHVDERLFTLTAQARGSRIPPPHCSNPEPVKEAANEGVADFANTINPLFFVSKEQIYDMDKEVEEDMSDAEVDPYVYDIEEQNEIDEIGEIGELGTKREYEDSDSNEYQTFPNKRRKEENSSESDYDNDDDDEEKRTKCGLVEDDDDDDDPVTRFRRGEGLPDDLDLGDISQDSVEIDDAEDVEDDREWNAMGAALEREFLSD